jgi:hypothetical protein
MKTLAELSFDYIWLLFSDEDIIDFDYSLKMQESLSSYFESMTETEKEALSQVATQTKARLLAEPDEHGYTPRKLVTEDQKVFLDAVISGELFG